jgi:hypothetical protein
MRPGQPGGTGRTVPKAERPNGLMNLIYLGALSLTVGVVTLGIGLFQA